MAAKYPTEEKDLFYEFLRRNGMKRTHQKDLILGVFLSNEGHMSVEDVYALAKKLDRKVGIVTVFRTLKALKECGIAKEIALGDGLTRFEHCYGHPLHHHIVCTQCHKVIEFLSPDLERIQQAIVSQYDFQPFRQRIQIEGVCRECRNRMPAKSHPKHDSDKVFARDALRLAIAVKSRVLEFYESAARLNRNPRGRAAFETIAKTERAGTDSMSRELELLLGQEKGLDNAPLMLHFEARQIQQLFPGLLPDPAGSGLLVDARRARKIGAQLDARCAEFFAEYAERFGDCDGKRIFQRLAHPPARKRIEPSPGQTAEDDG
jgi:Fur family ferric uptake transcriptional regulator